MSDAGATPPSGTSLQAPATIPVARKMRMRFKPKFSDVVASCAFVVALASAAISYTQMNSAQHQIQLSELQIRPYVRLKPYFTEKGQDKLAIFVRSENFSSIPAHIIYSEIRFFVDRVTLKAFFFNKTGEILYQHKNGIMAIPDISDGLAKALRSGRSDLMGSICVVYASVASTDARRWLVKGLYGYVPHDELPEVEYLNEEIVPSSVDHCDTVSVVSDWMDLKSKPGNGKDKSIDLPKTPQSNTAN